MSNTPMKVDQERRVYVRVAMRDTLGAYDLADLLGVMAEVRQGNADVDPAGRTLGLPAQAWQLRADVLRQAADRLHEAEGAATEGPH